MNNQNIFSESDMRYMLKLARQTMEARLSKRALPEASECPDALKKNASCFVTLHTKSGGLRGCIGNMEAFEPLAENIVHNAVASAFRDPRFIPVESLDELAELELEISVLTSPENIKSYNDFIVGEHGVIMFCSGRSAVFLPQVAPEQGWDRETTLTHLSMKAGLPADAWKSPQATFKVFRAIVFSEKELFKKE